MDNQELFNQVIAAMNEQTEVLTNLIDGKISASEKRLYAKIDEAETRINVKMENEICKRIDTLFDGYKLTHEKQYELEREVERLKAQVDEIRTYLNIAV